MAAENLVSRSFAFSNPDHSEGGHIKVRLTAFAHFPIKNRMDVRCAI